MKQLLIMANYILAYIAVYTCYPPYTWVVGVSGDCTCCAGRIYIKWSLVTTHIHKVITWTSGILDVPRLGAYPPQLPKHRQITRLYVCVMYACTTLFNSRSQMRGCSEYVPLQHSHAQGCCHHLMQGVRDIRAEPAGGHIDVHTCLSTFDIGRMSILR